MGTKMQDYVADLNNAEESHMHVHCLAKDCSKMTCSIHEKWNNLTE